MNRREFLGVIGGTIGAGPVLAQAPSKSARIGWLTAQQEASLTPYLKTFREGMAELGYIDGRNLVIEFRYGDDDVSRIPALASDLLQSGVDLIVAQGEAVGVVAKLNLPVPVVYIFSSDPVAAGLAESLSRPRGNMTGRTFMAAELNAKRLEILKDFKPDLLRVAIIANTEHPGESLERASTDAAGRSLGLTIDYYGTRTSDELRIALAEMANNLPEAISVFADGFATQNRQAIVDFATPHHIPVISAWRVFAQSGALFTYGPRLSEVYRRLGSYVDRVLRGTRPVEIPIEQPTKFELILNIKTAKMVGLKVPPTLLARADEVIE